MSPNELATCIFCIKRYFEHSNFLLKNAISIDSFSLDVVRLIAFRGNTDFFELFHLKPIKKKRKETMLKCT